MSNPEFPNDLSELEEEFGDVMRILAKGPLLTPTETPGPNVWNAIASELGGRVEPVDEEQPPSVLGAAPDGPEVERVVSLDERRPLGRRVAIGLAAVAAIILVAVPVGLALQSSDVDQTADLLALDANVNAEGEAQLRGRELTVDVNGLVTRSDSFYELWLLDLDGDELQDLVSLGPVEVGDDGTFVVPGGIDLARFDVVDVSIEIDDGNPDHSGQSVLRGDLT